MPTAILLRLAFDAVADYAPSGELLAEAEALQRRSTTWTPRQGGLLHWTTW